MSFSSFSSKYFLLFIKNSLLSNSINIQTAVSHNEIIKWNNKYRHPLIIPAFVNEQENNAFIQPPSNRNNGSKKNLNNVALNIRNFEPKNRSDE